jgi:hypothetical protein
LQTICDSVGDLKTAISLSEKGSNWNLRTNISVRFFWSIYTTFGEQAQEEQAKDAHEVQQEASSYMVILNLRSDQSWVIYDEQLN